MTQEEKQILLKDLCGRLPYGVNIRIKYYDLQGDGELTSRDVKLTAGNICYCFDNSHWVDIKPYLRPMSSMTDDEREEIEVFIFNEWYQENSCKIDKEGWIEILANYDVSGIDPCFCSDYIDWLNAHHFDYRGLIPMGLALEAPEDMYKN